MVGEDPTILQGEATLVGLLPITAIQDQADPEADPEGPSLLKIYSDQLKMVRDSFLVSTEVFKRAGVGFYNGQSRGLQLSGTVHFLASYHTQEGWNRRQDMEQLSPLA